MSNPPLSPTSPLTNGSSGGGVPLHPTFPNGGYDPRGHDPSQYGYSNSNYLPSPGNHPGQQQQHHQHQHHQAYGYDYGNPPHGVDYYSSSAAAGAAAVPSGMAAYAPPPGSGGGLDGAYHHHQQHHHQRTGSYSMSGLEPHQQPGGGWPGMHGERATSYIMGGPGSE